jgi:hypothetical protein
MKNEQIVKLLGSLVAGLVFSTTAHSAMISCNTDTTINYMQMDDSQASGCLASGVGNINGNPNNSPFISGVGSDYELASKSDEPNSNSYNVSYSSANGTWSFDSDFWDSYSDGALGFKFGTGNTADEWFVFSLESLVNSGDWAFFSGSSYEKETKGGLSHVNLYGKAGTVTVPEPGTLALLGLGLCGLVASRKKMLKK